ncbi:MAG: HAMP domain-containing histidine kinase [Candidatus Gastranaerophilales bacterium]|nr:HAMP domain-containing histidine kinase [Candidatus Gastranaerophilales bacterium]
MEQESRETKSRMHLINWITCGLAVSLLCAVIFTSQYDSFGKRMEEDYSGDPKVIAQTGMKWLYRNNYLLYRDLYNMQNDGYVSYSELYLQKLLEYGEQVWDSQLLTAVNNFQSQFEYMDQSYSDLNLYFDYLIEDTETGNVISNIQGKEPDVQGSALYISFIYDEAGNVELGDTVVSANVSDTELQKFAREAARALTIQQIFHQVLYNSDLSPDLMKYDSELVSPQNCRVVYRVSVENWTQIMDGVIKDAEVYWDDANMTLGFWRYNTDRYLYLGWAGGYSLLIILFFAVILAGMILPWIDKSTPWRTLKIFRLPIEVLTGIGFGVFCLHPLLFQLAAAVIDRSLFPEWNFVRGDFLRYLINDALLVVYFFILWYLGVSLRSIWTMGLGKYLVQRSLIVRFFIWVYRNFDRLCDKITAFYLKLTSIDLTKKANKYIIKVVLINAVILFLISFLWVGGWPVTIVYSLVLYLILRKYVSDLQKQYSVLLNVLYQIAEGHLNVSVTENMGVFEPLKPQISRIQEGFGKAVSEETKSQRMKAELITNVSHDLKTPLTAIITYIDLLKDKSLTEKQREQYLDTLDRKAIRLKALIEDLFEVSKANSQNVTLHLMEVDLVNLLKQVAFELEDKLKEADLDLRMILPDEKISLQLDSQKTYRIFENLFGNVAKYALHGTRVYVECRQEEKHVEVILKNIAAEEITVSGQELTERFVRGDASRGNTDGNGLGLAIAKSFAQLQGGSLNVDVDGDLFKVTVAFYPN